ncbi:MAG: cupin domain-containing protein, partial [Pseudomonadota bacterium]
MAPPEKKNLHTSSWQEERFEHGVWSYLDLSGEHLGVRVEKLIPGDVSSLHHYHTMEEEHVIALGGSATLCYGDDELLLEAGDHVCFKAGEEVGHHITNHTDQDFIFLIIGERNQGDVCIYPRHGVAA